jgi:hypothetical protein
VHARIADFRFLFDHSPFYDLNGVIALQRWGENPSYTPDCAQVEDRLEARSSNRFRGWVVFSDILPHSNTDVWWAVQTVDARASANLIRKSAMVSDYFYKDIRRAGLMSYCQYKGWRFNIINHKNLIGVIHMDDNNMIPISASGHIVNMLLTSSMRAIDWKRYMDTIEWNFHNVFEGASKEHLEMWSDALFSEWTSVNKLAAPWHNIIEWEIGVWAYIGWLMYFDKRGSGLNKFLNERGEPLGFLSFSWVIGYILRRFQAMKKRWPDAETIKSKEGSVPLEHYVI